MESLYPEQLKVLFETGVELATAFAPKLIGVVFIFLIGKWLAGKFSKIAVAGMKRAKVDATLSTFFGNLVRYVVLTVAALAALEMFGIKTTSLVGILAAAGFAVGLALQGSLSNFSAGVMLLLFRPYNLGDVVNAGGSTGEIIELNLFTTVMKPPSGEVITIPNGEIFGGTITNFTPGDIRMCAVPVGVEYPADIDQTMAVLEEAAKTVADQVKVQIVLTGLGASSVDYEVRAWVPNDRWIPCHGDLLRACKYALDKAKIGIPYQTIDVNLFNQG